MRILGIVGGTGPESTIDYYRRFIDTWRERGPAGTYPRLIIDSVEGGEVVRLLGEGEFGRVAAILSAAMDQLTSAGAGAAMIASNATHLALEGARTSSAIPLIHIVDVTAEAARRRGYRRVGLIGTRFVMQADLYPERFGPKGIEVNGLLEERVAASALRFDAVVRKHIGGESDDRHVPRSRVRLE